MNLYQFLFKLKKRLHIRIIPIPILINTNELEIEFKLSLRVCICDDDTDKLVIGVCVVCFVLIFNENWKKGCRQTIANKVGIRRNIENDLNLG